MYINVVMAFRFLVDFLLLLAVNRLYGFPPNTGRNLLAGAVGGLYSGLCLLKKYRFLHGFLLHLCWMILVSVIAFGVNKSAVKRGAAYMILSMAIRGAAAAAGSHQAGRIAVCLGVIFFLCFFTQHIQASKLLPVELVYGQKNMRLLALADSGNTLRDPVTGGRVLVVGPDVAENMVGLSRSQLETPIESMKAVPGLRLIPYSCVGTQAGFLLALRFPYVKVGNWQGSTLVAFAPNGLSTDGSYQALTGGCMV